MTAAPSGDEALAYYYHGLYAALVRYRLLIFAGWLATLIGGAGMLSVYCRVSMTELLSLLLPLTAIVTGLALVHQSVATLDSYVQICFPKPDPASTPGNVLEAIEACSTLMEEIERGGWQEAYAAIQTLKGMPERFGIPPP